MDTTWKKDGLLFGTLSQKDCANGGKWTVGNIFQPKQPGYSEIVKYKTWVARADKYRPGSYPFKDRIGSGLWEYVITMLGVLVAMEKDRSSEEVARVALSPGITVEFPPDALRSWELPPDQKEARGSTILWSGKGMRADEGLGGVLHGFCFESWTEATVADRLHRPFPELNLRVEYVEVFKNSLLCHFNKRTYQLQQGDFVYVRAGTNVQFEAQEETYGTVLYYL